jgi:hypothetical protein
VGGEVVAVTDEGGTDEGGTVAVARGCVVETTEVDPRSPAVVDVGVSTAKRNESAAMANSATTTHGHGPPK